MRVLHVIPTLDSAYGGPTQALVGLATAQQQAGLDVRVCATLAEGEDESLITTLDDHSVSLTLIRGAAGPLRSHPELKHRMADEIKQADIVHIHTIWEQIQHLAAKAARQIAKPYIFRPCGMLDPWSLRQGWLKKRLYLEWRLRRDINRARAMHFTSEIERDLVKPLRLKPESIVEPNGVRLEEFETLPPAGTFRRRHPQIGERPLIVFMSRVHPKKGLDLLIPAFAALKNLDPALAIIGPGSEEYVASIRRKIDRAGIGDRVVMTGMLKGDDRIAALHDANLFVLPSYQENFGVVVVEALAAGTPVLISDQVNIYREIERAGIGQAVPTTVEALADAMETWITDATKRSQAAEKCRPFVQEQYDWHQIADRWAGHYERLVQHNAS